MGNSVDAGRWSRTSLLAIAAIFAAGAAAPARATEATILGAGSPDAVPGSYIVVLKDGESAAARSVASTAAALSGRYGGRIEHVYSAALTGYAVAMSETAAKRLAKDARVKYVAQDARVYASDIQTDPPSWGLDRVDQRNLPYDQKYMYSTVASNVNVYVLDTGIRTTHQDFGGRARHGRDTIDNDNDSTDCNGHGTHVAGTIGGALHGVAKGVTLWGVRVLNCRGNGSFAKVIAGIDWVTANAVKPAVANMSISGFLWAPMNEATRRSIASGVTYAIAAGNWNDDACTESPGSTPEAITVGATQASDARASFSNFGTCVDIFAPGVSITSTWHSSDTATGLGSGTSMAAPHVAGAAALYLAKQPADTPKQVRDALVRAATPDKVGNPGPGSPNRLLFTDSGVSPAGSTNGL